MGRLTVRAPLALIGLSIAALVACLAPGCTPAARTPTPPTAASHSQPSTSANAAVIQRQCEALLDRYVLHPDGPPQTSRVTIDGYAAHYFRFDVNSKAVGLDLSPYYGQPLQSYVYVLREHTSLTPGTIRATFVSSDGKLVGALLGLDGYEGPSTVLTDRSQFARR